MARGRKTSIHVELSPEQRGELERWLRCSTMRAGLVRRARAVLLVAQGHSISHVSRTVGMRRCHVATWAKRFSAQGIDGLQDRPGRGRKPSFSPRPGDAPGQDRLRAAG
jgi:hypothetical protein